MDVRYFIVCRSAAGWAVTLEADHLCDRETAGEALATARGYIAHLAPGCAGVLVDLSRDKPSIESRLH